METAPLWAAVIVSGLYHGANPGMGWPLAVSSALIERQAAALPRALAALALGHALAMLVVLAPFSVLTALAAHEREIRLVGGAMVLGLGLWLAISRRHPRFLARIPPRQLMLWSFCIALVHGAALMLVPIYLGLCAVEDLDAGHRAAASLLTDGTRMIAVALLHTGTMVLAGGALAFVAYRWAGLGLMRRSWFDLDRLWALSLVLVGALGIWAAI